MYLVYLNSNAFTLKTKFSINPVFVITYFYILCSNIDMSKNSITWWPYALQNQLYGNTETPMVLTWTKLVNSVRAFFISNAFFATQTQCCLTFSWIELQMLLRFSLIHIATMILRHIFYLVYLCPSLDESLFMLCLRDLFFNFSLIFIDIIYVTSFLYILKNMFQFLWMITWMKNANNFQIAQVQPQSLA